MFKYFLLLGLSALAACTGNIQASSPQEALAGFYQSLDQQRCAEAAGYRPDYPPGRCQMLDKGSVRFTATPLTQISGARQLFELQVAFSSRGTAQSFDGYVAVVEQNGRWIIDSQSYEYKQNADRQSYIARYFPSMMPTPPPVASVPPPAVTVPAPMTAPIPALPLPLPTVPEAMPESAPKRIVVDVASQQLHLYQGAQHLKSYPVSTALAGEGSEEGSNKTPLGFHQITRKIGADAPERTIFRARRDSGEIAELNREGAGDLVTSRILWLSGLEPGKNAGPGIDSYQRYIYIHGTAEENKIGSKASHGCVRMYNKDVIELFDLVDEGTLVEIQAPEIPQGGSSPENVTAVSR